MTNTSWSNVWYSAIRRILQSVQMPMAHILTYRSEKPTQNRLIHANSM